MLNYFLVMALTIMGLLPKTADSQVGGEIWFNMFARLIATNPPFQEIHCKGLTLPCSSV
jgi:hypothetical protein